MSIIEKIPPVLANYVPQTLNASLATGLLQLGCRCLSFSIVGSSLLGGCIYLISNKLNDYIQKKCFGELWNYGNGAFRTGKSKALEFGCTILTGVVTTILFEMIVSAGAAALWPALGTGALVGLAIYTATKVAAFIINKCFDSYGLYNDVETFFRWITWQTYSQKDVEQQRKIIESPLNNLKILKNELIKEIEERNYPYGTKPLKKKDQLEMISEIKKDEIVDENKVKDYVIENPWHSSSDNPHDDLHKLDYVKAKEEIQNNFNQYINKIDQLIESIERQAEILIKNQKPKIEEVRIKITDFKRNTCNELNSEKIILKMELKCWNEVGLEPVQHKFTM